MALRTVADWTQYFIAAKMPDDASATYAKAFYDNRLTETSLNDLSKEYLKDLEITVIGDIIAILKHIKTTNSSATLTPTVTPKNVIKPPEIKSDMTHPQYRKFKVDWNVYKHITNIPISQIPAQIYNLCDDTLQHHIINSVTNFFTLDEKAILTGLETIVTKQSNPTVHRMNFSSMIQSPNEQIKDYLIRLKTYATDCEFTCSNCQFDLSSSHIKDQFIRGLHNDVLQTDILAKAGSLKTLEDIVKHSEAFETAINDQLKLQTSANAMATVCELLQNIKSPKIMNIINVHHVQVVVKLTTHLLIVHAYALHGEKLYELQ